jgi:Outer membrane protein
VADAASAKEWEYSATIEDLLAARLALVNSVVDTYFYLAYLDEAIRYTRDSLENYRRIEKIASARYFLGKSDALEQAQARQAVLSSEDKLIGFETQAREYEETLRNLLNLHPGQRVPAAPMNLDYPDLLGVTSPGVNWTCRWPCLQTGPTLWLLKNGCAARSRTCRRQTRAGCPK